MVLMPFNSCVDFLPVGSTNPSKKVKYTNPQINYLIKIPPNSTCPVPLYMLFCGFILNMFLVKSIIMGSVFSFICHIYSRYILAL